MHDDAGLIGHRTVTADAAATFGSLTGDYSRIHFDHELGKATSHGRGFAHGLLSASWALGAMTLQAPERLGCGEAGAYLAGFQVRFRDVVRFGDTLAVACNDAEPAEPLAGCERRCSDFTVVAQDARTVAQGAIEVRVLDELDSASRPGLPPTSMEPQSLWPTDTNPQAVHPETWSAEDLVEHGPRGARSTRTLTETDVVNYVNFSGELNPLYIDASFAEHALFGTRTVPPMLCFCLGFSRWLRELLRLPMRGSESSAGHLGDRWHFLAPVLVGDTLEVRYRPLSLRRTRSQPTQGVATFGLQLVNQREQVVQQGEVDMLLAMREPESP